MLALSGQSMNAMLAIALTWRVLVSPWEAEAFGNRWCRSIDLGGVVWGSSSSLTFTSLNRSSVEQVQRRPVGEQGRRPRRRGVEPVREGDVPVVAGEVGPDDPIQLSTERLAARRIEAAQTGQIRFELALGEDV